MTGRFGFRPEGEAPPPKSNRLIVVLSPKVIILLAVIALLMVPIVFLNRYEEIDTYSGLVDDMRVENVKLKEKITELEKKIADLKTDEGVERVAREKLKLIKKGESVMRIVEQKEE